MVTVLTRGERHRNPGAPTSNRQTYRQTSFSSGQTTPADARSRIDYKSLHTVYPAPFKQTLINFHRFAEKPTWNRRVTSSVRLVRSQFSTRCDRNPLTRRLAVAGQDTRPQSCVHDLACRA